MGNKSWKAKAKARRYKTDSVWEAQLQSAIFDHVDDCKYHPCKINYVISSTYEPDWSILKGGKTIYVEAKGHFEDNAEARKYKFVRDSLTDYEELVFLFMKPHQKLHFRKPRKDGTTQTHAEWAEKNGFRWFDAKTIWSMIDENREKEEKEGTEQEG